ncbi:MAG: class I SAM-dependent methyltransferase [Candidatus Hydrogenedentota bacterium]
MPILSEYARRKKIDFFLKQIPKTAKILEIGCRTGWVKEYLLKNDRKDYTGIDLKPPADIVGNILEWRKLGLKEESYDVIIGFEVIEHVDCIKDCYDLLKPGGMLMLTSPKPNTDWLSYLLELLGLSQKRTSPHTNLIYFKDIPYFKQKIIKTVGLIAQWAICIK